MTKAAVAVVEQPTRLETLTKPYSYKGLCYGSNRDLVKLLEDNDTNFFAVVRIEPFDRFYESDVCSVFQDLIPKLCQMSRIKPIINRLVDLHLYTSWTYPIRITLIARSKVKIQRDLAKLLEILNFCLNKDRIEEFRGSCDKDHQQWCNAVAARLKKASSAGLKLEPSVAKIYSREELEEALMLFISPHPSDCGHRGGWDD